MIEINNEFEWKINNAISFLAVSLNNSGHNSKPVLFHSIRIGLGLYERGYSQNIVVVALLHDVLEDSDITESELEKEFGNEITMMIKANSFDRSIKDKTERFKDMFKRCYEYGKEVLIIKAIDILDNSNYIQLVEDDEIKKWLLYKMKYFLDISKEQIDTEPIWNELNNQFFDLCNEFKLEV